MPVVSPSSLSAFTRASRPSIGFIVVSTPRTPMTVVTPARAISCTNIIGVWSARLPSPLPPSRWACGSIRPGTTTQSVASIRSVSTSSASSARRSIFPIFSIRPLAIRTDCLPCGSGS
jgi:hypothetical protein